MTDIERTNKIETFSLDRNNKNKIIGIEKTINTMQMKECSDRSTKIKGEK